MHPIAIYAAVALLVLAIDVASKRWSLSLSTRHLGWSDSVHLTAIQNARVLGTFSLGHYAPAAHSAVFLMLIIMSAAVCQRLNALDRAAPLAFGLLIGGALGNGLELLTPRAAATDFLAIAYAPGAELVFNLADVAALAGLVLLAGTAIKIIDALRERLAPRIPSAQVVAHRGARLARREVELPRIVFREGMPDIRGQSRRPGSPQRAPAPSCQPTIAADQPRLADRPHDRGDTRCR